MACSQEKKMTKIRVIHSGSIQRNVTGSLRCSTHLHRSLFILVIVCIVMLATCGIASADNATVPVNNQTAVSVGPVVAPTPDSAAVTASLVQEAKQSIVQTPLDQVLQQQFDSRNVMPMRNITSEQRTAAARSMALARGTAAKSATGLSFSRQVEGATPGGMPDYFGTTPNWALSPAPVLNTTTGTITGGIRKFVDSLPGLGSGASNNLGKYIPTATADAAIYPGADYYEIGLVEYQEKMHSDLPPTRLRGYVQLSTANVTGSHIQLFYPNGTPIRDYLGNLVYAVDNPHYLGPIIVAQKDRPVRVKFTNYLPTGTDGDLMIPTDTTVMGAGQGPDGIHNYTQNRATLHLHGGATPWISDGTPDQWTTPVGENATWPKGVSVRYVPDMDNGNEPPGTLTFYYTNQQSARLMFYHDHAYGITRLNVYVGEAAGYLIQDPTEAGLVTAGTIPATQIPLVIQDKTFVDNTTIAKLDPTWNWGTGNPKSTAMTGDLWFPHVYMPNQNPAVLSGTNANGRWDYGPWFWPPQAAITYPAVPNPLYNPVTAPWENSVNPGTPNPSLVPEAFVDTPLVNGNLYPYLQVGEQAYRFRVLNAANDRTFNLQLYYASTPGPIVAITGGNGTGASGVAIVNASGSITGITITASSGGAGYNGAFPPSVLVFDAPKHNPKGSGFAGTAVIDNSSGTVTSVNITSPGIGYAVPTVCKGPGAPSYDNCTEVSMIPASPGTYPSGWPTADGRDGGWPDPNNVGPSMIQIGTEGGILPAPAIIQNRPIGYDYNRRIITVLNVLEKALFLGPAERADVIVDFSQVPTGSTLILYNDAPAPVPAFDPRNDYYTGDPDQTTSGGAPQTLPGYGPNTRTVMQFQVNSSLGIAPAYNLANLQAQLPVAYAATQAPPIVPVDVYNTAFGGSFPADPYLRIQATCATFIPVGQVTPITMPLQPKAIQELFTTDYGRMNAILGVEIPFTNLITQTTIPYEYADPPTEIFNMTQAGTLIGTSADGTQIWKITHNGVDTHAVHFHMFNVQVINRVGWDGQVKPPLPQELGWKDTVIMNPLEDIIVAMRPIQMTTPASWGELPNSIRALDVTRPLNTSMGQFTGIDPNGLPVTVVNHLVNFGDEYVWHCHLLGHEENDMMRTMAFASAPSKAPTGLIAGAVKNITTNTTAVFLAWRDTTITETDWTVQSGPALTGPWTDVTRVPSATGPTTGSWAMAIDGSIPPNTTPVSYYRVMATNVVGDSYVYASPSLGYPTVAVNSTASTGVLPAANSTVATANFIGSPTGGVAPLTVQFTDLSTGSPTGWSWSFGDSDSTNASVQSPVHTYQYPGNYTVSLTAMTIGGNNTLTLQNYIVVTAGAPPAPIANFVGTPLNGSAPLTVKFTDLSGGGPTSWNWTFGDGSLTNVTQQNPVHTYALPGNFTVSLNATNAGGSNTAVKIGYINVSLSQMPPPTITSNTPASGFRNTTVNFTIVGTNFRPGFTTVEFRNQSTGLITTTLITVTATRINGSIMIPTNASLGLWNIRIITVAGGENTRLNAFTVAAYPPPTLTSITPVSANRNTTVSYSIVGTNFEPGLTTVVFRNATGSILNPTTLTSVTTTRINGTIIIPKTAWIGPYNVNISTADGGSTPGTGRFAVTQLGAPTLTSITPATGYLNSTVSYTIVGTNFELGLTTVVFKNATGSILSPTTLTSVTATQINGTIPIPANAVIGAYNVNISTADGGSTPGTGRFTVARANPPTLTSITPVTGYPNTTVAYTIVGTNFIPGQTTVVFKNASGFVLSPTTLTSVTATQIIGSIAIPKNAVIGAYNVNISTINGGSTPGTGRFTVALQPAPTLTSITPATGYLNSTVSYTIVGSNFIPGQTNVVFKNATGTVLSPTTITGVTATQITGTIAIPKNAVIGAYNVNISTINGGSTPGTGRFTVARIPAPVLTTITPATGFQNTTVSYSIVGTNFIPGQTTVVFKNATGSVLASTVLTSQSTTRLNGTIVIPPRAWIGAYNVNITTIDGGSTPGTGRFTVSKFPTPTITSFTPTSAFRGTQLSYTVVGTNFQPGLTSVTLTRTGSANIATTISTQSTTTITGSAAIPGTAATGLWTVNVTTIDGGSVTRPSAITFI
jgi:PKD repeat protein/FtsP/CotA-like multicopper oxidase with cupredoxin domain